MSTQPQTPSDFFSSLKSALQGELEQLRKLRQETTLFSGEYLQSHASHWYYRFEISEDLVLRGIERVTLRVGQLEPLELPCKVISLENQYLTLAVPVDFGSVIPEAKCRWDYEAWLRPILDQLALLDSNPTAKGFAQQLLTPDSATNQAAAGFPIQTLPTTPADQQDALQKIMQNRVTMVWGPILTGKAHLLALLAANYVKAGKTVLFVAPTSERVDDTVLKAIAHGQQLGIDMTSQTTRIGLPLSDASELMTELSFEHQANEARKSVSQEQSQLLEEYWAVRVRQVLNEDIYIRLNELRERATESKKQADQVAVELNAAREQLKKLEGASMLEKMKKTYKDELALAQKKVADKQAAQKKLQTLAGTLSNEVLKLEVQLPVRGDDLKAFQDTVKRIGELGGLGKLQQALDEAGRASDEKILAGKKFIGTTLITALTDERLRSKQFDLVMVDDAEVINLPMLAALASRSREKLVIVGDPFQVDPESITNNELAQNYLQRDVFMYAAQTDDLHRLFEWSEHNKQWSIFLSSQYATTPKVSQFVSSIFFDGKLKNISSASPKGKLYFIDTSPLKGNCEQYVGRKKILPYNDTQAKKTVECVKHALLEPQRHARDIGVIAPFPGPTLYLKLLLRLQGIKHVEVGTPQSFRGRRKKAIIFDTTMAGVDHTMRPIDDRKVGEQKIISLLNTVLSCVGEDLYILADMSHFQTVYKDRVFTKLLMLLQAQADGQPNLFKAVKQFDELEWNQRAPLFDIKSRPGATAETAPTKQQAEQSKLDAELALRLKMMAKKQTPAEAAARNYEQETFLAVLRVLGRRTDINLLSLFTGGDILFHSSLTTEQAMARVMIDFCQGEKEFREIMERWNLIIYEKSGGGKNTSEFYTKQSPETRVRTDIYHLKSYYAPDVELALEEGKQKLAVAVSKVFQETLGKPMPTNPTEWITGYLNILGKLESYLAWISEQLRK
ncbi:MAG TPA: AAA domain-containing protein [Bacteroidota bacterium]|nr:AAA domain-containing protein [Bacteroidota bacterium]